MSIVPLNGAHSANDSKYVRHVIESSSEGNLVRTKLTVGTILEVPTRPNPDPWFHELQQAARQLNDARHFLMTCARRSSCIFRAVDKTAEGYKYQEIRCFVLPTGELIRIAQAML